MNGLLHKGAVKTQTVTSERGYRLGTAHLESQRLGHFARDLANIPAHRGQEGWQPYHMLVSYRHLKLDPLVSLEYTIRKFSDIEKYASATQWQPSTTDIYVSLGLWTVAQ